MTQTTFDGLWYPTGHATARNSDPSTSHEAAAAIEASGKATAHRNLVLAYVREHPGLTAGEISNGLGFKDRHVAARRLSELRDGVFVSMKEPRICTVDQTKCMTWWAT